MQQLLIKTIGLGLNLWSLVAPNSAANLAAKVFSTPPKTGVRAKERQFLDTARQIRRTVADQNIVEYHWGHPQAPLVLLSYGWAYNAGRWRHFVPDLLEAGFQVIAYDPPGHGLAPSGTLNIPLNAAIIRALVEQYGAPYAIVGHSFGGSSAVYALKDLPVALHPVRMVVMASFSFAPRVFRQYKKALGLWSPLYWQMVRNFEKRVRHSIDYFDFALMSATFSHVNALLIHAPADKVTPYLEGRRYHDFWPGSHLFSPDEGGHHLGTADITRSVLQFVTQGILPETALKQERPMTAEHELAQYFLGV
jgi:pimeloyl-ACP methyl ester carboxylesterase